MIWKIFNWQVEIKNKKEYKGSNNQIEKIS